MSTSGSPAPLLSVVIPAYNEGATIETVLLNVLRLEYALEILVVDDGSQDETATIVKRVAADAPEVRLLSQPRNGGKGSAVRAGIAATTGRFVIIQDADLEYDPSDIPRLMGPMLGGRADAVFGSRLRGGQPQRAHLFWHYVGNRFLSLLTCVLFNTTISDMEVGYKLFNGDLIRSIPLRSDDFRFEPEITAKILRRPGIRIFEVPISYYGRSFEEGKKITWRDGARAVGALLRFRFMED